MYDNGEKIPKCSSIGCDNYVTEPGAKFCKQCVPEPKTHKCRHMPCSEQAVPGSAYCQSHQTKASREGYRSLKPEPPSSAAPLTPLGDAQVRVAKAQEERDRLFDEMRRKHGSLHDLQVQCACEAHQGMTHDGPARKLSRAYNAAVKELRLAKSDLERMRNVDTMQRERPAPAKRPDEIVAPKAHEPAYRSGVGHVGDPSELAAKVAPKQQLPEAPAEGPWWEGGPRDTVRGMPWHEAVKQCPPGREVLLKPGSYALPGIRGGVHVAYGLTGTHTLSGPMSDEKAMSTAWDEECKRRPAPEQPKSNIDRLADDLNRAYIEDHPDVKAKVEAQKPGYIAAMDAAAEKREKEKAEEPAPKRQVQQDLEGKPAHVVVSGCIKVPKEKAYFETPHWTLSVPKEETQDLVGIGSREGVRNIVEEKLRKVKGAVTQKGDFDRMVDYFTDLIMRGAIDHLSEED